MILSEILSSLKYGELAQVNLSNINTNETNHRDRVISNINAAITEVYNRLPILQSEVIIQQYPHISTYELLDKYTQRGNETYKYIEDSIYRPFYEDTVIKIEQVFTEHGEEVPLNNEDAIYSLFTPSHNSLMVPYAEEDNAFSIVYKAKPRTIPIGSDDSYIVDIPYFLLELITTYTANRVLMTYNTQTADNNFYAVKFEKMINNVLLNGLINTDSFVNYKLEERGFA